MINIWEILKNRYWSQVSTAKTDKNQAKNFCLSVLEGSGEGRTEKQKKLLQSKAVTRKRKKLFSPKCQHLLL